MSDFPIEIVIVDHDDDTRIRGTWSAPWMMGRNRGEWIVKPEGPVVCEGMPEPQARLVTDAVTALLDWKGN